MLQQLVDLLALEPTDRDVFGGSCQDLGWGGIFGGQVLGQALSAATQTVPVERLVHSLHGYFLLRGDVTRPLRYDVERIRDGKSFTTRRVTALQDERVLFSMLASFQMSEDGFDHQDDMPEMPGPEGLASRVELARQWADQMPAPLLERLTAEWPIEIRPVDPVQPLQPEARPAQSATWYRTRGELPDEPAVHRFLLAYASDFNFLSTSMHPHAVSLLTPGMQVASLDHAMWFHRAFRMDEWVLHVVESPSAAGARGLVRGRMFDRQGRLIASTAQEGLIRQRAP